MKIETYERGVKYMLYIPPCDIQEVAKKCGSDVFDAATDKTAEDEQAIALLKLERRDYVETHCFTHT